MSQPLDNSNPDVVRCREAAKQLGEFFDSVQVFATRHESGELDATVNIHLGVGNWFTRYGQIKEWCLKEDERARISARDTEKD